MLVVLMPAQQTIFIVVVERRLSGEGVLSEAAASRLIVCHVPVQGECISIDTI